MSVAKKIVGVIALCAVVLIVASPSAATPAITSEILHDEIAEQRGAYRGSPSRDTPFERPALDYTIGGDVYR